MSTYNFPESQNPSFSCVDGGSENADRKNDGQFVSAWKCRTLKRITWRDFKWRTCIWLSTWHSMTPTRLPSSVHWVAIKVTWNTQSDDADSANAHSVRRVWYSHSWGQRVFFLTIPAHFPRRNYRFTQSTFTFTLLTLSSQSITHLSIRLCSTKAH